MASIRSIPINDPAPTRGSDTQFLASDPYLASRYRFGQALVDDGSSSAPTQSRNEGIARIAKALIGAWSMRQTTDDAKQRGSDYNDALAKALSAGEPWRPPEPIFKDKAGADAESVRLGQEQMGMKVGPPNPDSIAVQTGQPAPNTGGMAGMIASLTNSGNKDVLPLATNLRMQQIAENSKRTTPLSPEELAAYPKGTVGYKDSTGAHHITYKPREQVPGTDVPYPPAVQNQKVDVARQTAEARAAARADPQTKYTYSYGVGPSAADPEKEVPGTWRYPTNSDDEPKFFPGSKQLKKPESVSAEETNDIDAAARAIANYQMKPPSSSLRSPRNLAVIKRVMEINPEYDATQFDARSKSVKDFSTGRQGQQIQSFNVALDHMDTLRELGGALKNGDIRMFNSLAQRFAAATGNPAPVSFDAAKRIIGQEVVKAIVGMGGGVEERKEAGDVFSRVNSPEQLEGALDAVQKLMVGQLRGLKKTYEGTTKLKDFENRLDDRARKLFRKHNPPAAGDVIDGYKFKGGDPANQANWEKAS